MYKKFSGIQRNWQIWKIEAYQQAKGKKWGKINELWDKTDINLGRKPWQSLD